MAVPAFRTSPARKRKRRSHHAIKATTTTQCPNCGSSKLPHTACRNCGYVRPGLLVTTGKDD